MSVNTKKVEGRRELHFSSLDDLRAEAEWLASGEVKVLGNWSVAQMFAHVTAGLNSAIDGSTFKAPFFFKLLAPLLKNKFLNGAMPAGFKIPKGAEAQFLPSDAAETQTALESLQAAIDRLNAASESDLAKHPLFGKMTQADMVKFHLRHAEMHFSFAIPPEA